MKDRNFILTVCVILLFFAIASPVLELLGSAGIIENRLATKNLLVPEKQYSSEQPLGDCLNRIEETKTGIRNIYSNCIPFYPFLVSSVQKMDLACLQISDALFEHLHRQTTPETSAEDGLNETDTVFNETKPAEPEQEKISYQVSHLVTGRPHIFSIEPLYVLERVEGASDRERDICMKRQLQYLDCLCEEYPDLHYYVYMGTRLQDTEFFEDIIPTPASTYSWVQTFVEELHPAYKFDYLHLDTPEDRVKKQYRTDHHWNAYGAYEGYQQIMNMMYEDSPILGKPLTYEIQTAEGMKWYGSMASGISDPAYMDDFTVFNMEGFPHYSGNGIRLMKRYEHLMDGKYATENIYSDYYGTYFQPMEQFTFDSNTGHNLLLIGDSYSWSIAPLIAAHFDHTYCYNKPWVTDHEKYDYNRIIEENEITDVLILLYSSRLLFGLDSTDFDNFLDP